MSAEFDFNQALEDLRSGKDLLGKEGVLTPLIKQLSEAALAGELEAHISRKETASRRNGYTRKMIKTPSGSFELDTPRDRDGSFEPQLIKKHQTHLTDEVERKILSLFALGMSYNDIAKHIEELYAFSISSGAITAITDKIIPELKAWQQRPLDKLYPFVWLDAIFFKTRTDGKYQNKAVYTVLALNLEGHKEILGLYIAETEGAKFWMSVLSDLQARGVEDILIASVDGLRGFPEAIQSVFSETQVQLCIVHQVRNSLRYVASKHHKEFMRDLKLVYRAANRQAAEQALDDLEEKWGEKYAPAVKSWREKWEHLSAYFEYPQAIRKIIYTTNTVEAVHRQFRKLTKTKSAFPNDNSLLKLLFVGMQNAAKKWTMPIPNWNLTLSQLAIYFGDRLIQKVRP